MVVADLDIKRVAVDEAKADAPSVAIKRDWLALRWGDDLPTFPSRSTPAASCLLFAASEA
jgi:hypothetical protein